jgi:hypothetical protein
MDWSEFQKTAERLAQGSTEGDWRSAVSRAYYAVFHFFREFLFAQGLDIGRGGQSHFNLYSGLLNCGVPAVMPISRRIDDCRRRRVSADYELGNPIDQAFAVSSVQQAGAVVTGFQALLNVIPAAQIASGARQHLQAIGRIRKTA